MGNTRNVLVHYDSPEDIVDRALSWGRWEEGNGRSLRGQSGVRVDPIRHVHWMESSSPSGECREVPAEEDPAGRLVTVGRSLL